MLFYDSQQREEDAGEVFLIHVRFYKIFTAETERRRAERVEGEGVKVNRSVIAEMLNKHTCVFASSELIKIEFL